MNRCGYWRRKPRPIRGAVTFLLPRLIGGKRLFVPSRYLRQYYSSFAISRKQLGRYATFRAMTGEGHGMMRAMRSKLLHSQEEVRTRNIEGKPSELGPRRQQFAKCRSLPYQGYLGRRCQFQTAITNSKFPIAVRGVPGCKCTACEFGSQPP
jgi:hypothetical protein